MGYFIELTEEAESSLKKLHIDNQRRIRKLIKQLKDNPELGKKLIMELSGFRSLRIGKYRVIYVVNKNKLIISIVEIGHRKEVYDKIRYRLNQEDKK